MPRLSRPRCRLCGSDRFGDHFRMESHDGALVRLEHCLACDAVMAAAPEGRIEAREEIARQTAHHERLWSESSTEELADVVSDLRGMIRQLHRSFGETDTGGLVVDLGAGRGSLLKALQDEGYRAIGCEPSAALVELARRAYGLGPEVLSQIDAAACLASLRKSGIRPDVIVLWHVLEHMSQPRTILRKAYELLQPKGRILAQIPMLAPEYLFPEHLFFASSTSFHRLVATLEGATARTWPDDENLYLTVEITKMDSADDQDQPSTVTGEIFVESLAARRRDTAGLHAEVRESRERIEAMEARMASLAEPAQAAGADQPGAELPPASDHTVTRRGKLRLATRLASAEAEIANHAGRVAAIRRELDERDLAVQTLETQNAGLESNLEVVRRRFARADDGLRRLQGLLADEAETARVLNARVVTAESQRIDLEQQIDAQRGRIDDQAVMLQEAESRLTAQAERAAVQDAERIAAVEAAARLESSREAEIKRLADLLVESDARCQEHARDRERLTTELTSLERANAEQAAATQRDLLRYRSLERLLTRFERDQEEQRRRLARAQAGYRDLVLRVRKAERAMPARVAQRLGLLGSINPADDPSTPSDETAMMSNLRSLEFSDRPHNRYWWHRLDRSAYVPLLYSSMTEREWALMDAWFTDTEQKFSSTGEANIPPLSMLMGLISGNGLSRIVQCGHYVGYSTLVLGFLLRRQNTRRALFSVDIDAEVTRYTQDWVDRAGLDDVVHLHVGDSASEGAKLGALEFLGGRPELVFIDSSHQYEHTLRELDVWYEQLVDGGFILMHDTSEFAASFDSSDKGGVLQAAREWCATRSIQSLAINSFVKGGAPGDFPYLDGCGITLIQKLPK